MLFDFIEAFLEDAVWDLVRSRCFLWGEFLDCCFDLSEGDEWECVNRRGVLS